MSPSSVDLRPGRKTLRKRSPGGEISFRAYPNTGALYHIDLYLIVNAVEGLAPGGLLLPPARAPCSWSPWAARTGLCSD